MAIVGTHKPPFKGGSLDYMRWYARLRAQHLRSGSVLSWRAYYAEAKAKAVLKPPKVDTFGRAKLFGGALTPEYRRWYYRLQRWHSALPREQQDWPKFFAAARAEAEAQQLRTAPVNSST